MKIFLSWSGDSSKQIAEAFRDWLPAVIQAVKPFFPPDDIEKGTRWSSEIASELEESQIGLLCLTRENVLSPWIMFEAGVLSKSIEKSKVIPMLFGLEPSDIRGPLLQFQAAVFREGEVRKLVKTINSSLGEGALSDAVIEAVFEKWWPDLEKKISKILRDNKRQNLDEIRKILEELLVLARGNAFRSEQAKESEFYSIEIS